MLDRTRSEENPTSFLSNVHDEYMYDTCAERFTRTLWWRHVWYDWNVPRCIWIWTAKFISSSLVSRGNPWEDPVFFLRPITIGTTVSANTYLRLYPFATYKDLKHVPCRIEQTTQFYIAIAILLACCPPSCTCLRKRGTPNYKQKVHPISFRASKPSHRFQHYLSNLPIHHARSSDTWLHV